MKLWAKMRVLGIAFLLASLSCDLGASDGKKPPIFTPPEVGFVSDIPYPIDGSSGMVGLLVNLDNAAQVKAVQVLRDVPSLTGSSLVAVHNWTFVSAKLNQKPCAANFPVEIVFDPGNLLSRSIPLQPPVALDQPREPVQFAPAQVLTARYAAYPAHNNEYGTVVLDVTVNKSGRARSVSVVRSHFPSLTKPTVSAVRRWRFKPGTLDGTPISSKIVVVFVFRSPSIPSS